MSTNASTFHSPLVCPLFTRKLNTLYPVQSSTMRTKADWRLYSEGPSHKVHLKSLKKGQPYWDARSRRATERESYVCRHRRRSSQFFSSYKILWLKRQNWLTNDFNSCITFYMSLFLNFLANILVKKWGLQYYKDLISKTKIEKIKGPGEEKEREREKGTTRAALQQISV